MVWSDRRVREEKLSWWRRRAEQVELRDSEQSRAEQSDRPDQGAQEWSKSRTQDAGRKDARKQESLGPPSPLLHLASIGGHRSRRMKLAGPNYHVACHPHHIAGWWRAVIVPSQSAPCDRVVPDAQVGDNRTGVRNIASSSSCLNRVLYRTCTSRRSGIRWRSAVVLLGRRAGLTNWQSAAKLSEMRCGCSTLIWHCNVYHLETGWTPPFPPYLSRLGRLGRLGSITIRG